MAYDYLNYGNYQPGTAGAMIDAAPSAPMASAPPSAPESAGGGIGLGTIGNIVGGAAQGVGALANIYGMYQQKKQAEKNYQLAKKAYEDQKRRAYKQDDIAEEQLRLQNMMTGAEYAGDVLREGRDAYGTYQQTTGRL